MFNKLSDPAHPLWKIIRLLVVCVAILVVFQIGYSHGLGSVDIMPIVTILATLAGFDQLKSVVTSESRKQ